MRSPARRSLAVVALLALAAFLSTAASAADVSIYDPRTLAVPPIGRIPAVKPERFVLGNGVVVYLLEDHELPVVKGIAYFPASPALVPDERAGLGQLAGTVMRSGGTAAHSGDWLDDRLSAIGASIDADIGPTLANTGFRALTENANEVIGLWTEMLRQPAFPDEKIELAKVEMRQQIASRNDEMIPMLLRLTRQAVYGKGSPWARQVEYATLEPITAADCRRLHDQVFVPERMIVAIYGDFRVDAMKKLLAAKLGEWKRSGTPKPVLPPTPRSVEPRLYFADKEDVTQSGIVVAQPGSRADDPDYASLEVLEQGLGGASSSRMYMHIRTQRGLAYATGASAGADFDHPGVFLAYSLTQSESTMTALSLVRDEVRQVTQAPFTDAELQNAKQAVVNGFVFNFEDPSQTLFRAAYYEAVGYPADFLQRYQKALDGVTASSVLAAAQHKITPEHELVAIVGHGSQFDRPLESAGLPVERIDISIPPPPSKLGTVNASPEAKQRGRDWLEAAATAAGGSAAWAGVHALVQATQSTLNVQGQSIAMSGTESWRLPDHRLIRQQFPFGEIQQVAAGAEGWVDQMGQVKEEPRVAESVARDFESSLWRLLSDPAAAGLVALDAPQTIDGVSYRVAAVPGAKTHDLVVLFTPDGHLAGCAYQDEGGGAMAPARVVQLYSDWRAEGPLQFPHALKATRDGKPFMEVHTTSLQLNPALGDDLFKKPSP